MCQMEHIGKKVRNTFAALAILKHKWVSCTKFQVRLSILMLSTLILKGIIGQLFHCFLYLLSDFLTESRALWFWISAAVMRNSDKIVNVFQKCKSIGIYFNFPKYWIISDDVLRYVLVYDRNRNFGRNFGQLGRNISAESFGQPAETPKQAKTSFFANFWQFFSYFLQIFFYKY